LMLVMGLGPPPGAASRSSTPTVRSIRQPVPLSVAKLGMEALPPASAARAAPVADIMATKQIKPCLDMFHPWQQTGFAAHPLSPDLPVLQQVEQSPRAPSKPKKKGEPDIDGSPRKRRRDALRNRPALEWSDTCPTGSAGPGGRLPQELVDRRRHRQRPNLRKHRYLWVTFGSVRGISRDAYGMPSRMPTLFRNQREMRSDLSNHDLNSTEAQPLPSGAQSGMGKMGSETFALGPPHPTIGS